jgi:neutral trehalase
MAIIQNTTPPSIEDVIFVIDEKFHDENGYYLSNSNPTEFAKIVAIEFAKLHCTQALKQANESADANVTFLNWLAEHNESLPFEEGVDYEVSVINSSILDSYDLNLIK